MKKPRDIEIIWEWRRSVALGNCLCGWKEWFAGLSEDAKKRIFSPEQKKRWEKVDFNYWLSLKEQEKTTLPWN